MNKAFGDFQTPLSLVQAIVECLSSSGKSWSRVLEPTCGRGNFIGGLLNLSNRPQEIQAIELQDDYVLDARKWANHSSGTRVIIKHANIFDLNFQKDLQWQEKGPLLVIGNPPWVTNSELGSLKSENLPHKSNIKKLRGIDARTGGSNFDIAEYIWLKLIKELAAEQPTIALLCKISVASRASGELERLGGGWVRGNVLWPSSMEEFLSEYFQNASTNQNRKGVKAKRQVEQGDLFSDKVTVIN